MKPQRNQQRNLQTSIFEKVDIVAPRKIAKNELFTNSFVFLE